MYHNSYNRDGVRTTVLGKGYLEKACKAGDDSSSRSRFLTSMSAFPNLFSSQHCRCACDMASSAVYPMPYTRSCEAASASRRRVLSELGHVPGDDHRIFDLVVTRTRVLESDCQLGQAFLLLRVMRGQDAPCVLVSWKRPALQYIMNCSAQLK